MKQTFSEAQVLQLTKQQEAIINQQQKYLTDLTRVLKDVVLGIEGLKEIEKDPDKVLVKIGPGILIEAKRIGKERVVVGVLGYPFVFLMAVVATDYTEIGLIWSNIGKKTAIWLPIVAVPLILITGYLFNILL